LRRQVFYFMNNRTIALVLLAAIITLSSAFTVQQDNNPNGSSELSLLMRKMEKQLSDARPAVLNGKYKGTYPKEFDKIYTAKPTDNETKMSSYDVFANVYISAVKSFVSAKPADQVDSYNNVVNTCLACHSQHCPGPVGRIKKLLIPN
jgi:cytochrome c553